MADYFEWTEERINFVKDQYNVLGPVKLAETLEITSASIVSKAQELGIIN